MLEIGRLLVCTVALQKVRETPALLMLGRHAMSVSGRGGLGHDRTVVRVTPVQSRVWHVSTAHPQQCKGVRVCTGSRVCVCARAHVCVCVPVCANVRVCIYICVCVCTCLHVCIHESMSCV